MTWNISSIGSGWVWRKRTTAFGSTPIFSRHVLGEEPVAERHGRLVAELLTSLISAGSGRRTALQREHPEGHMPGLVAHHVTQQLLEQRLVGQHVQEPECGQGQILDHDLHAEIGDVPATVVDDVVEELA